MMMKELRGLRQIRQSRGITQRQLAADLCIARESVSSYENGTGNPGIQMLLQMSRYFDVSVDYLIRGRMFTPRCPDLSTSVKKRKYAPRPAPEYLGGLVGLRRLRLQRGITQRELARELSVTREAVSYYENGKRNPDIPTLLRLSCYFDVSVDFLLSGNNYHPKNPFAVLPDSPSDTVQSFRVTKSAESIKTAKTENWKGK